MKVTDFKIKGPLLIELQTFGDSRGFFVERFRMDKFKDLNFPTFIQENYSRSGAGILRGLHFQYDLPQGKLITVTHGKIFDVAVDIRKDSPTYGQHISVEIDGDKPCWFWIPAGFAHGFCVLSESADLFYKVDNYYNPKGETGIMWNDPEFKIDWPVKEPLLSARDTTLMSFAEYKKNPKF